VKAVKYTDKNSDVSEDEVDTHFFLQWANYPQDLKERNVLKIENSSWTENMEESNSLSIYTRRKFSKNDVISCYPGQWHIKPTKDPYLVQYVIKFRDRYLYPTEDEAGDLKTDFLSHLVNFSRDPNVCLEIVSLASLINTGAPRELIKCCRNQSFKYIAISRAIRDLDMGTELFIKPNKVIYIFFMITYDILLGFGYGAFGSSSNSKGSFFGLLLLLLLLSIFFYLCSLFFFIYILMSLFIYLIYR
jgi:hypothetical protein